MFTLQDGREHLYQWDLDRYIIVNDAKICEVHFCNRTSDCSLVVEVKDGLAAIPNILLQDARPIRAYAYCDDKYTLTESQFTVKSRTKPSDYVYEETTVVRVDVLLDRAEQAITTAEELKEYFDTHTLEVKDDGEGNVTLDATIPEGGEVNLDNYYTKAETNAAIEEAIESIEIPEPDLTNYATQQFVLDKVSEIDIPEVPTNVSAFTNDAGYLTEHQDISGKADKEHTHSQYLTEVPSEYITETELSDKGYLTEHQSLAGYATETYVDTAISNIDIPEPDVDLSNYYTKAETDTAISDAKEVFYFNFDYNSWTKASDEAVAVFNRLINGEQLIVCLKGMYSYAVADIFVQDANNIIFKTHFTDAIGTSTTVNEYLANYYNNSWDVKRQSSSSNSYATQTYVTTAINEALSGIATAEGGSY